MFSGVAHIVGTTLKGLGTVLTVGGAVTILGVIVASATDDFNTASLFVVIAGAAAVAAGLVTSAMGAALKLLGEL